jgi:hypothetical protein
MANKCRSSSNSLPASKHCTTGLSVPPGLDLSFHPFFQWAKTPTKGEDSKEKLISSTLIWNRIRLRTLLLFVGFQLLVAGKCISLIATLLISHTTPAAHNCLVWLLHGSGILLMNNPTAGKNYYPLAG